MKILITGATGFIGRNLVERLQEREHTEILTYGRSTSPEELVRYTRDCDFLYHLAAVHRPDDEAEFEKVNHKLFAHILALLRKAGNACPVLLASSIHTGSDTGYGRSKLAAENELKKHAEETGSRAIIYRLTNTFGRYARPNSHSVVATFCHNIANGLPVTIEPPGRVMRFYYIDDVIDSFVSQITDPPEPDSDGYYRLPAELEFEVLLIALADKIYYFKTTLDRGEHPKIEDEFSEKLYKTFLSYLPDPENRDLNA